MLAEIAEGQHGVVSHAQLAAIGIGRGAVKYRVAQGRLHRAHRGVYAVGHPRLTVEGKVWAAVLACGGPGLAVVSHRAAAAAWELRPWPTGAIDVTSFRRSDPRPGIRVHHSRTLDPVADVDESPHGFPVTTVARTLVDLADVLSPHAIERIVHRAEVLRLLDVSKLAPPAGRRSHALQSALDTLALAEPQVTENDLEEAFLAIVSAAGLPRPRTQVWLCGSRVDFFWPEHAVIVEVDGRGAHLRPSAFEGDRRRDGELQLAGYRVFRFTRRQVLREPRYVVERLRAILTPR